MTLTCIFIPITQLFYMGLPSDGHAGKAYVGKRIHLVHTHIQVWDHDLTSSPSRTGGYDWEGPS